MPKYTQFMDPEERAEWALMLDESLNGSRQADQAAIDRLEVAMESAAASGRLWPQIVERQWLREGMRLTLQAYTKEQDTVLVGWQGRQVSKSARRGVRVVDEQTGRTSWQQKLFEQMTWEQFDGWRENNQTQIESLQINEVMASKIAALRVLAPESTGPQDAAEQIGTTLEAVLSA